MNSFTYKDYIHCIHKYRLHAVMNLMDESVKYERKIINKEEDRIYDEFIRNLIKSKDEIINMFNIMDINIEVDYENLKFIGDKIRKSRFQMKKIDGLYKIQGIQKYIAIEYQKDKNIAADWRMLNYCIDIMKDCIVNNKNRNQYPTIIPIILHNGDLSEDDKRNDFKVNFINVKEFLMKKRFE